MRKTILPLLAAVVSIVWPAGAAHAADGIRWGNSLTAAMAQAKKTNKLIMVDFYTDWCGYCKKLDAETYTDPAVIQEAAKVIPLKLDAEREGKSLAQRLRPHGFPSIYFLNSKGEVEGFIGGFEPAARFLGDMKDVVQLHRDLPVMQSRLQANPNDLPLAGKLTAIYAGLGKHKQASETLTLVNRLDPDSSKGFRTRSTLAVARMWIDANQADQAVPLIRQATQTARNPEERAVAHINLAMCYGAMNNINAAETELNTTIRLPNCPDNVKQAAQQFLSRIQQYKSQGH